MLKCSTNKHVKAQDATQRHRMSAKTQASSSQNDVIRFRSEGLKKRIAKLAKAKSVNPPHIIRQAIIEYIEKQEAAA